MSECPVAPLSGRDRTSSKHGVKLGKRGQPLDVEAALLVK